jgi:YVTN family beta-propeller protein
MKKMKKKYWIIGILLILVLLIVFPGRKWAREHVNAKTATTDHPLACHKCHLYTTENSLVRSFIDEDYLSPFNMVVSKDGNLLYIVAQESNELLVVDAKAKQLLNKIEVGNLPHSVVLGKNEERAYVSNQWADYVSVIDLKTSQVVDSLTTGNGPAGLSLSADGKYLYVVNSFSSDVSILDLASGEEVKRLTAGNNPTGIQLSPNGKVLYVTSRRAEIVPYGEPVVTKITVISDSIQQVIDYKKIESAHIMENIAFTPSSDLGLVTIVRPKNLVPSIQVERGWMMTFGIAVIEQKKEGRVIQLLIDEPNAYYSDPYDIAITPDGKKAFISSSGVNTISVINLDSVRSLIANSSQEMLNTYSNHLGISSRYITKRIQTGACPKGIALSPDGKLLYVTEQLEDRIAVINTENLEKIENIDLGSTKKVTVNRQGRRLFANSGHTFQNQFGCYTCHPDMHEDGLVYNMASKDMGRNLTNTQSLRDISHTAPFKWNGKNQTVYKQDGMRFSTVLTRTEAFSYDNLDAITAYILTGIKYPPNLMYNPNGILTESQLRGKDIFERSVDNEGKTIPINNRCVTCHPAPYFTNLQLTDVGTLASSDDSIMFDVPHLNNIYASAPYLHDGRAFTLEEIWTKYGGADKHGRVNDLSKIQLNELIDYLRSLSAPQYEKNNKKNNQSIKSNY